MVGSSCYIVLRIDAKLWFDLFTYLHVLLLFYLLSPAPCAKWSFVRLGDDYIDIEKAVTDFSFHYEKLNSTRFKINIGVDQINHGEC